MMKGRSVMSDGRALKKTSPEIDGFEGYEDRTEGDDRSEGGGVIRGSLLRFSNEAAWLLRDDEEMPAGLELAAVNVIRVVQKWKDGLPEETIILEPGQKFPDVEKMNEAAPKAEWVEGPDGKKRGPWQAQHVVYLLNLETMDRYSYPTGTVGGGIAVRELVDKTKWMRRLRGENVHPVVTLSDCFMNTRFGGRQRPSFTIKKWINLGDDKVLPTPSSSLESSAPPLVAHVGKELAEAKKPVETPTKKSARGARKVAGPALEEILNDDLPDSLK
jgi:hypothetical protein